MKKLRRYLIPLLILFAIGGWTMVGPTQTQAASDNDLDTVLARAAVKGYLVGLTRNPANRTNVVDFYLTANAAGSEVAQSLNERQIETYEIVSERWLEHDTYQVMVILDSDNKTLVVETQKITSRWQVTNLTWDDSVPQTSAVEVQTNPATVGATPDPYAGTLVIQTESGGPIYAIDANGSNLRYLTAGIDPALSPDGQQVAFTRWDSPGFGASGSVWVINIDGSGERAVLGGIGRPKSPTWSPDGQQLAFNLQLAGGYAEARRTCKGSLPPRAYDVEVRFTATGELEFCFYLPPESFWGLRMVDVTTGTFQDLPNDTYAFSPAWDPANPARLVYDSQLGLVSLDVSQGTSWPLTDDLFDHSPAFSPDGSKIAVSYLQHDHWEIHVLNADGSGRIRLTETSLQVIVEQRINGEEQRSWNNVSPTWSPDGSQIAFLTDRTGRWEIWVMNVDGSHQRPLLAAEVLNGLDIQYNNMDERVISWQ